MKLSEMLRQHLEWLDDEDGTMPFPEFEGETGWVSHDDGSIEDWGQYLLRLSLDEVTQLEAEIKTKDGALNTCAIRLGRVKAELALKADYIKRLEQEA